MKLSDYVNRFLPNEVSTNFRNVEDVTAFVEGLGDVVIATKTTDVYQSVCTQSGFVVYANGYVHRATS
jgi:hypothetical protein